MSTMIVRTLAGEITPDFPSDTPPLFFSPPVTPTWRWDAADLHELETGSTFTSLRAHSSGKPLTTDAANAPRIVVDGGNEAIDFNTSTSSRLYDLTQSWGTGAWTAVYWAKITDPLSGSTKDIGIFNSGFKIGSYNGTLGVVAAGINFGSQPPIPAGYDLIAVSVAAGDMGSRAVTVYSGGASATSSTTALGSNNSFGFSNTGSANKSRGFVRQMMVFNGVALSVAQLDTLRAAFRRYYNE